MKKFLICLVTSTAVFFTACKNLAHEGSIMVATQTQVASYGTWKSPITAQKAAQGSKSIINTQIDPSTNSVYWAELRPTNKGRYTIVKRDPSGKIKDVTPLEFNVRSAVHEYGGAPFLVHEGTVYFANFSDHAVYVMQPGSSPTRLTKGQTAVDGKWNGTRFAEFHHTPLGLIAIGEEHTSGQEAENFIALIDLKTGNFKKIESGSDFYASIALSPDNKKIAFITWDHPNMPWSNTELWTAEITSEGTLTNRKKVAGDRESLMEPRWSKEGKLHFISDRNNWWNLYRDDNGTLTNLLPMDAEFGKPLWWLGRSSWDFIGDNILFSYTKDGKWSVGILDPQTGEHQILPTEGTTYSQVHGGDGIAIWQEDSSKQPTTLIQYNGASQSQEPIYAFESESFEGYISQPTHIAFPSANGRTAYGLLFLPINQDFRAPEGELPPLIVHAHGGPTAQAVDRYSLSLQYFTSQGYAFLDVNYGGSTGYGREYRSLLDNNWGIVDVDDSVYGAKYLVDQGIVDPKKLAITGGSAGGYTTLAALAFRNTFHAGASHYGVADATALAQDTHKFESQYLNQLLGDYNTQKYIWEERSPINAVDQFCCPLILFQGDEDTVVPPNQSQMIYDALKAKGIKTELHMYKGEQHGFRKAENIAHSLENEARFYREVFGNTP